MSALPFGIPTDDRRAAVDASASAVNGIDYVTLDPKTPTTLSVYFLRDLDDDGIPGKDVVHVLGGTRITSIAVIDPPPARDATHKNLLVVTVDKVGDFSTYTLAFDGLPPPGANPKHPLDPQLASVDFNFHVDCPTRFDCGAKPRPPVLAQDDVSIDYLAKDYATFRRAMLDRLSLIAPHWRERHPADLGVALVESLAYVADRLSYRQDAIATEAYFATARRRVSVRRHARLVDYAMDEGCNARAWVQFAVATDLLSGGPPRVPKGTRLFTTLAGRHPSVAADDQAALYRQVAGDGAAIFETMADLKELYAAHAAMPFYAWSETAAMLAAGATRATLAGAYPALRAGDVLILAEVRDPRTGVPEDADPLKRHAVVLSEKPVVTADPVNGADVTEIAWSDADALPFALVVSATVTQDGETVTFSEVGAAHGNVVLADAGRTLGQPLEPGPDETLGTVPERGAFAPQLAQSPLTWAGDNPYALDAVSGRWVVAASARDAVATSARDARPSLARVVGTGTERDPLTGATTTQSHPWTAYPDLLDASIDAAARAFVVEVDENGTAALRFGDGVNGVVPPPGTVFTAAYRIGNGSAGNVGAEAIAHVAAPLPGLLAVRNPIRASGGTDPVALARVRADAPWAFRTQQRAVTLADYARVAQTHQAVLRAAATRRWTGSWYTVFVVVETRDAFPFGPAIHDQLVALLERYRMAGTDVEIEPARLVSVDLALHVCASPGHRREDVADALTAIFTDGRQPDGSPGLLHPDRFLMGERLWLSPFVAAAQSVAGVASVSVDAFARSDASEDGAAAGVLVAQLTEVFTVRNNPDYPERGTFTLAVDGGA